MRSAAVVLVLVAVAISGCEASTTMPAEFATRTVAIAKVRDELPWVQLSDYQIESAMLAFCRESSFEAARVAPTQWLIEWAFSQPNALSAETNDEKTDAWAANMGSAGFGGSDVSEQLNAFAIEVGLYARAFCPDKWDRFLES